MSAPGCFQKTSPLFSGDVMGILLRGCDFDHHYALESLLQGGAGFHLKKNVLQLFQSSGLVGAPCAVRVYMVFILAKGSLVSLAGLRFRVCLSSFQDCDVFGLLGGV